MLICPRRSCVPLATLLSGFALLFPGIPDLLAQEWRSYGNDAGGSRFSALSQIHRGNVAQLRRAWTYRTGEVPGEVRATALTRTMAFESTPLVVDGVLYLSTPSSRVIALDAETGRELWVFDPQAGRTGARRLRAHRGVAWWPGGRILFGTSTGELIALDAKTGKPCLDFGDNGRVSLRAGVADQWPQAVYSLNSPPATYKNLAIVGAEVPEGEAIGPSGLVRAYDVRSGKLAWTFHTVPRPGEFGSGTWEPGSAKDRTGANVWSAMSVDTARGLVFLPIGSPSYDFYGGDRKGQNLFGNSLVALRAATGQRVWHYQIVHHDLWDYDLPAQPMLLRIGAKDAVVQITKMGFIFVFHRESGTPIFPIEERPVPASNVPGEEAWPTQPFPLKPPPLSRTRLTSADLSDLHPESARECSAFFQKMHHGGIYTPWSERLTLIMPGTLGGGTWSGGSYDPKTNLLYVNANEFGAVGLLRAQDPNARLRYKRVVEPGQFFRFGDSLGVPCQSPPWGTLQAIDLRRGEIVWKKALGTVEALAAKFGAATGAPNMGGSIVTAGGIVFIGGTNDSRFRAFDAASGEVLWETRLEASAHASPITYRGKRNGLQYVAVAAGGGGFFSPAQSDVVAAYALP